MRRLKDKAEETLGHAALNFIADEETGLKGWEKDVEKAVKRLAREDGLTMAGAIIVLMAEARLYTQELTEAAYEHGKREAIEAHEQERTSRIIERWEAADREDEAYERGRRDALRDLHSSPFVYDLRS
ncbi:hypothetical protein [Paracoccus sulfuroxidans]|uniref:Uncharacterized protein n=1 Tax=Paracoccus sulfuroxidans TaxID=384678 RepID=A0A562P1N8_9RHOB|nr:hypothetical protein [Paracoccus sulfuroxidans]TWI38243.1 hypothetical protein IQ24_00381 [Paracoccus sulfuroxidans]